MDHAPRQPQPDRPRAAAAVREALPLSNFAALDQSPGAAAQRALIRTVSEGPRLVAQRQALARVFGPAAGSSGVIQLGNNPKGPSSGSGEKDKVVPDRRSLDLAANEERKQLSTQRFEECAQLLGELVKAAEGLPAQFEIAAAGSFARRELTELSDLDFFSVVPDECPREQKIALDVLCKTFVSRMGALHPKLLVEYEPSGTVDYIRGFNSKGQVGRDVAVLFSRKGEGLASAIAPLSAKETATLAGDVIAMIDQALEGKKAEVKGGLYRPMHLYARLLGQAFETQERANSIGVIDDVKAAIGARTLTNDLKAALVDIHVLRGKDPEARIKLKKDMRRLLAGLRAALLAYRDGGNRMALVGE